MATGAELITAERERQIKAEGWTQEHDAAWTNNELAIAAAAYATALPFRVYRGGEGGKIPKSWPFRDPY